MTDLVAVGAAAAALGGGLAVLRGPVALLAVRPVRLEPAALDLGVDVRVHARARGLVELERLRICVVLGLASAHKREGGQHLD